MKRVCVINISGLSGRLIGRTSGLWLASLAQRPVALRPTFPAVSASVQASMTTGASPGLHGVIAGGIYRRQSRLVSFEERSNTLLNKKRFWHAKPMRGKVRTALVFWSNPLAGAADLVLGAVTYGPAGITLCDQPVGLYKSVAARVGACDPAQLRGPSAGWAGSSWITSAAADIWNRERPELMWVYMPGVNFEAVRHGPDSTHAIEALRVLDFNARRLGEQVQADGGEVVILSDGGYTPVAREAWPNVRLRQAGLLTVTATDLGEMPDLENSRAFAMVDHQVAHIYCIDEAAADEASRVLRADPAIAKLVSRDDVFAPGVGRERAGELVAMSASDAWFCYRWWADDSQAPHFARRCDVQGKCGYDPCELFAPIGGARDLAGEIDPNPGRIRASRGLVPDDPADCGAISCSTQLGLDSVVDATSVPSIVQRLIG